MEKTTRAKRRFSCLSLGAAVATLLAQSVSGLADQIVLGEKGNWNVHWCGVNSENSVGLGGAAATIGQALQAAKTGDVSRFYGFWDMATNRPSESVKSWYEEWHSKSQRYVYLIGQTAVMVAESNSFSAVSIAPAAARESGAARETTNPIALRAQVVFAKQVGSNWMLLRETVDQKVEQELLARAASLVHQPQVNFTKEGLEKQDQQFNKDFLEMMQKNGASPERIASQKERYQIEEAGKKIDKWIAWTNNYKTDVFVPPIEFDKHDQYQYSFRDPVSAFRSYMHAMWIGDAKTLLKYADRTGRQNLQQMGVNEEVKQLSYDLTNMMTHVVILFTATTEFDNQVFALVFWRAQNEKDPRLGSVALQSTIFVKEGDEYLLTRKLRDGYFGKVLAAAGLKRSIWKFADFQKELKQSSFPPHFYTIP